jgi:hypothetical protein
MFNMRTSIFAAALLQVGCFSASIHHFSPIENDLPNREPKLHHLVFCWLKDSGNSEHRSRIIQVCQEFDKIPVVLGLEAGEVVSSDRSIVEDGYDVGMLIIVKDEEDLQRYLDHPIHRKAKTEVLLPLVEKIVVYDFKSP